MHRNFRLRYYLYFLLIILQVTFSCAPDPEVNDLENWSLKFDNGLERIFPGEKINVSLDITDNLFHKQEDARVLFEIIKGGGMVSDGYPPVLGTKAETVWSPGDESSICVLKASVFSGKDGHFLLSRNLEAYNFISGCLIQVSDSPDNRLNDLVADTINRVTLAVLGNELYRQGERFYQWTKLEDPLVQSARTIDIDRNNVIYVTTGSGNVVRSTDDGLHWTICTKPYPDIPYFVYFTVSNDGWLWTGRYGSPVRFSKDGGNSWITAGGNLPSYMNGNVFRLKSGEIVLHGSAKPDRLRLNISNDNGLTWTVRETPGYSLEMYVDDRDRIFVSTQENGRTIYRTTDLGITYEKVVSVPIAFGTQVESNIFHKIGNTYYIGVPGGTMLKSADLENFEYTLPLNHIREIFFDHNGTFIGRGEDSRSVFYYRNAVR